MAQKLVIDCTTGRRTTRTLTVAEETRRVNTRDTTRPKRDDEYRVEFATATDARKQEIRDIVAGLLPRETVPL
jgi:hypothetical protein